MNDVTLLFDASEQGSGNTLCLEFQNDVFMFAQLFISPLCLYLSPQHRENIKSIFHSKELTFATLENVCYKIQISTSAANRLIGEVVHSRRRPLLGPSLG